MGITKSVYGLVPDDERMKKLRKVYDLCLESGVTPPYEVNELFNNEHYIEGLGKTLAVETSEGSADAQEWTIVKLDELPDNIYAIAFVESW